MPNRIIKESICTSETIDELTAFEETFFYRLLVNCDDYGCFDARPKIIRSRLFPLKLLTEDDIKAAMNRLTEVGLIIIYEVQGKPYLQVTHWDEHQRVRNSVHRYPDPSSSDARRITSDGSDLQQVAASCGELRRAAEKCGPTRAGAESRIQNPESQSQSESGSCACAGDDLEQQNAELENRAHEILEEQNTMLAAAEEAGFAKSTAMTAKLIDLYADHGLERMLYGITECVDHGATTIAYLRAVLTGSSKAKTKSPPAKLVPAQNYNQRDNKNEDNIRQKAMDLMVEQKISYEEALRCAEAEYA